MFNKWLWLLLTIATLSGVTLRSYADCAVLTDKQVELVKTPLKKLLALTDAEPDDGYVLLTARQPIEQLKKALIDLVDARMACETSIGLKPEVVQQDLLKVLKLSELNESQAIYGYDLQVTAQRPREATDLVIVHISFGIPCGSDNLLIVYRYRDKAWHKDLVWKSNPYKSIAGAHGDYYDYLILPVKHNETPKLAIIHGVPWCTSSWNPFSIDVVKLAEVNEPQKTLLHKQIMTHTGSELDLTLKRFSTGFELRTKVGMLDSDLLLKQGIYRYQVEGDKVIRVQPVAENVRDFVDEWLTVNRTMAWQLSDKANAKQLLKIHAELKERYGYYGAVNSCQKENEEYQVAMTFNGTKESDKERLYYFIVKLTRFGYLVKSVSLDADPKCTGTDFMVNMVK